MLVAIKYPVGRAVIRHVIWFTIEVTQDMGDVCHEKLRIRVLFSLKSLMFTRHCAELRA